MKRRLLFLTLLACTIVAIAQTRDYVYSSSLNYDARKSLYYFDVSLEGDNYYTGYGMDIQMPAGLEVNGIKERNGGVRPNIVILDAGMYEDEYGSTEHTVTPAFPYPDDHTHARVACISNFNYDMGMTSGPLFRVYVENTYDSGWPLGVIKLYAIELGKVGSHHNPADREDVVMIHSGETTLPLNVSPTNHWSTCILPFATDLPDGVKAYTTSSHNEESIFLTEAQNIKAYTPYILYSENGYNGTVSGTVDPEQYPECGYVTDGNLTGAIVPQTATEGFVLQKQDGVVQFYAIGADDSFNIPAGKCWMNIPSNNISAFNFVISDDEDAILSVDATETTDAATYDLTGRRISKIERGGLYIKNGKKFIQTK